MFVIYGRDIRADYTGGYDRIVFHGPLHLFADPISPYDLTNKAYVDREIAKIDLDFFTSGVIRKEVFPAFKGDIRNKKGDNVFNLISVASAGTVSKIKIDSAGRVLSGRKGFRPDTDELEEGIPYEKATFDKYTSVDKTLKENEYSYKDFTADNANASGYLKLKVSNIIKKPLGLNYKFDRPTVIISREEVEKLISGEAALEYFKIKRDGYDGKDDWTKSFCSIVDHGGRPWAFQRPTATKSLVNINPKNYRDVTGRLGLGSKANVIVTGDTLLFVSLEEGVVSVSANDVRNDAFNLANMLIPAEKGKTTSDELAMCMYNDHLYVISSHGSGSTKNARIHYIKIDPDTRLPKGKWMDGPVILNTNTETSLKMVVSGTKLVIVDTLTGQIVRADISPNGKPINAVPMESMYDVPNLNMRGRGSEVFTLGKYLYVIPGYHDSDLPSLQNKFPNNHVYRVLLVDGDLVGGWKRYPLLGNIEAGAKAVVTTARNIYLFNNTETGTDVYIATVDANGDFEAFHPINETFKSNGKNLKVSPSVAIVKGVLVFTSGGQVFTRKWGEGKDDYFYMVQEGYVPDGVCGGVETIMPISANFNNVSGRPWMRQSDFTSKENRAVNVEPVVFTKATQDEATTTPFVYDNILSYLKLSPDAGEGIPVVGISYKLGRDGALGSKILHNGVNYPTVADLKYTDKTSLFIYNNTAYFISRDFISTASPNNFIYRGKLGVNGGVAGGWIKTKQLPFTKDHSVTIEVYGSNVYLLDNVSNKAYRGSFFDDGSMSDWVEVKSPFKATVINPKEKGGSSFLYDDYIYFFNGYNTERTSKTGLTTFDMDLTVKSAHITNNDDLGVFHPTHLKSFIGEGIKHVVTSNGNVYVINYVTPDMKGLKAGIEIYTAAIRSDKQLSEIVKIGEYREIGPQEYSKDIGVAATGNNLYISLNKAILRVEWKEGKLDYKVEQSVSFQEDPKVTGKIPWEYGKDLIGTTLPDELGRPWLNQRDMKFEVSPIDNSVPTELKDILMTTTESGSVVVDHNYMYTLTMEHGASIRIRRLELNKKTGIPLRISPDAEDKRPEINKFVDGEFVVPLPIKTGKLNISTSLIHKDNLIVFYCEEEVKTNEVVRTMHMVTYRFNEYGNITESPIISPVIPLENALHVGVILLKNNLYVMDTITGDMRKAVLKDDGVVVSWGQVDKNLSVSLRNQPFVGAEPFVLKNYVYIIPNTHWYRLVNRLGKTDGQALLDTEDPAKLIPPNYYYRIAITNDRLTGPWERIKTNINFGYGIKKVITSGNLVHILEEERTAGNIYFWNPSTDTTRYRLTTRNAKVDHDGRLHSFSNIVTVMPTVTKGHLTSLALSKNQLWIAINSGYYSLKITQGKNVYSKEYKSLGLALSAGEGWDRPWLINSIEEEGPEPLTDEEKKFPYLRSSITTNVKVETNEGGFFVYDKRLCYIKANQLVQVNEVNNTDGTGRLDFDRSVKATIVPLVPGTNFENAYKYSLMTHGIHTLMFALYADHSGTAKEVLTFKLPNAKQKEMIQVNMVNPEDGKSFTANVLRVIGNVVYYWKKGSKTINYFRVNYETYQRSKEMSVELPVALQSTGIYEIYLFKGKLHIIGRDGKVYAITLKDNVPSATTWSNATGPSTIAEIKDSKIYDIRVEGTQISLIGIQKQTDANREDLLIMSEYQLEKFQTVRRSVMGVTWLNNIDTTSTHFGRVNKHMFAKTRTNFYYVKPPEQLNVMDESRVREGVHSGKDKDFGFTHKGFDIEPIGGVKANGSPLVFNNKMWVGSPSKGLVSYLDKDVLNGHYPSVKPLIPLYTTGTKEEIGTWLTIPIANKKLILVFIDRLGEGCYVTTDESLKALNGWKPLTFGKPGKQIKDAVVAYTANSILVLHGGAKTETWRTHVDPYKGTLSEPFKDTFTNTATMNTKYGKGGAIVSIGDFVEYFTGSVLNGNVDTRITTDAKLMYTGTAYTGKHTVGDAWSVRQFSGATTTLGERSLVMFKKNVLLCSPKYDKNDAGIFMLGQMEMYEIGEVNKQQTLKPTSTIYNVMKPKGYDHKDPRFFTCNNAVYLIVSDMMFKLLQVEPPEVITPQINNGIGGRPWELQYHSGTKEKFSLDFTKVEDINLSGQGNKGVRNTTSFINYGRYVIIDMLGKSGRSWKIDPKNGNLSEPADFKIDFAGSGDGSNYCDMYKVNGKRYFYVSTDVGILMFPVTLTDKPIIKGEYVLKGKVEGFLIIKDKMYFTNRKSADGRFVPADTLSTYATIDPKTGKLGPETKANRESTNEVSTGDMKGIWTTDTTVYVSPPYYDEDYMLALTSQGKKPELMDIIGYQKTTMDKNGVIKDWVLENTTAYPRFNQGSRYAFTTAERLYLFISESSVESSIEELTFNKTDHPTKVTRKKQPFKVMRAPTASAKHVYILTDTGIYRSGYKGGLNDYYGDLPTYGRVNWTSGKPWIRMADFSPLNSTGLGKVATQVKDIASDSALKYAKHLFVHKDRLCVFNNQNNVSTYYALRDNGTVDAAQIGNNNGSVLPTYSDAKDAKAPFLINQNHFFTIGSEWDGNVYLKIGKPNNNNGWGSWIKGPNLPFERVNHVSMFALEDRIYFMSAKSGTIAYVEFVNGNTNFEVKHSSIKMPLNKAYCSGSEYVMDKYLYWIPGFQESIIDDNVKYDSTLRKTDYYRIKIDEKELMGQWEVVRNNFEFKDAMREVVTMAGKVYTIAGIFDLTQKKIVAIHVEEPGFDSVRVWDKPKGADGYWKPNPNYQPGYWKPNPNNKPGYWTGNPAKLDEDGIDATNRIVDIGKLYSSTIGVYARVPKARNPGTTDTVMGESTANGYNYQGRYTHTIPATGAFNYEYYNVVNQSIRGAPLQMGDMGIMVTKPIFDAQNVTATSFNHMKEGYIFRVQIHSGVYTIIGEKGYIESKYYKGNMVGAGQGAHWGPWAIVRSSQQAWKAYDPNDQGTWVPPVNLPDIWVPPVGDEQIWVPPAPDNKPNVTVSAAGAKGRMYVSTGYSIFTLSAGVGYNNYDKYLDLDYRPDDV